VRGCTGTGGGLVSLFLGVSASIRGGTLHSFDVRDCRSLVCVCVCVGGWVGGWVCVCVIYTYIYILHTHTPTHPPTHTHTHTHTHTPRGEGIKGAWLSQHRFSELDVFDGPGGVHGEVAAAVSRPLSLVLFDGGSKMLEVCSGCV
jgi:hypothetical protein